MASEFQPKARRLRGILSRLRRNQAGNVLILTAAFLIPLLALIGSGVDLGRTYIARQRLQFACDAASLAGRRAAAAGATPATVKSEATKFLYYNFPSQSYGTAALPAPDVSITGTSPTVVTVSVATTLPMTIMNLFGFSTMPVSANCSAQEDYVNTDVMLVLDTTASMNCQPGATSCTTSYENNNSKMAGMRNAVLALYDALTPAQTALTTANLRLRYGIVPYSSTVNIGKLIYLSGDASQGYLGKPGYIQASSPYNTCTQYTPTYNRWGQQNGQYCSAATAKNTPHNAAWFSSWNGCVEERQSNNTITSSTSNIPSDANDLNLDLVPTAGTSAAALKTQWPPFDQAAVSNTDLIENTPCPSPSKALQAFDRSQMQAYVNSLVAGGGTLTDTGMIWGGRLLSQSGIWSAMNPVTFGNMPVNRYLILMTDGGVTAYQDYYTSYGVENWDHRASANPYPGAATDTINHRQRFNLICNAIKNAGVQIWVVGFGQSFASGSTASDDTTALKNCASSPSQASYVSDSNGLAAKFTEIGQTIGALRLTK